MEVNLIILFLNIIFLLKFSSENYNIYLNNNIPIIKYNNENIIISTYIKNSIYNSSFDNCTSTAFKENYFYLSYEVCKENRKNIFLFNNSFIISFTPVNITKYTDDIDFSYILSLNESALDSLIILDYINKRLIIYNCNNSDYHNNTDYNNTTENIHQTDYFTYLTNSFDYNYILDNSIFEEYNIFTDKNSNYINYSIYENYNDNTNNINCSDLMNIENNFFIEDNLCYNHNNSKNKNDRIFVCELDYILFGHEDLKKDDVYLAKEIDKGNRLAYLDNMLNYCIFPEVYLDHFFTSFFSELNDECEIKEFTPEGYEISFYYITCPKKKIDIYTKRRKLSVIINKFSYKIVDLFSDSLDFLNKKDSNTDKYYFNIVFESGRKNFILGKGFFINKKIGYFNKRTYIYSKIRVNYTDDLTDINSAKFEKWLYILTAFSFTFLLLIFTIFGCIHSRKVKKELREMLK
jgi:hypothetical protein